MATIALNADDLLHDALKIKSERALTLRRMGPQDIDAVWAIEKRVFSSPWSKKLFLEEIQAEDFCLSMVIDDKNIVVAYLIIHYIVDEIHIANIAVAPEYQRCGIAFAVLQRILSYARTSGFVEAHLEVRKSNYGAITLYERLGFIVVGRRKNYYQQENEDALLMSCDLSAGSR